MNTAKKFTGFDIVTVGFIVAYFAQPAHAGWSGAMNGIGYGSATVNVRAYDTAPSKTKYLTTGNTDTPSAAIAVDRDGYEVGAGLPSDASSATEAKVKGFPGYIWDASTVGSDGDSTDNTELESRITITAADCASLEMDSSASVNETNKSGIITVNAKGTAGTAFWTRGIEYTGPPGLLPNDDPGTTNVNETLEFLKTNVNSSLRWDVLMVGPLDLNTNNCNPLTIPFTFETDITNLYFFTDGVAKSLPLVIECPSDIVVECPQPATYPETVLVGGCGDITVTFSPATPPTSVGTNPVTVTATDTNGNTASCTFNVIVRDTTPPAVSLAPLTIECGSTTPVTVLAPTPGAGNVIIDNCSEPVTVTPASQVYNGTGSGLTWTFTDAAGIATNVIQSVGGALTFSGFYPPINTVSNSCTQPSVVVVNRGSVAPFKFDFFCGTTKIIGGTPPTVTIQPVDTSNCTTTGAGFTVDAEYQNDWHYNWDTSGLPKNATYKVTVNLPGGINKPYVYIRIK